MKFKKNIIVIIPALAKNRYSSSGDLHQWGGSTLLEWKIVQAKRLNHIKEIYVATPDKAIKKFCKKLNVNVYTRNSKDSLSQFHEKISKKFLQNYLLYLYPTSPFLSTKLINKALAIFDKHKNKFDSLCTVRRSNDYFFYNKRSINFDFKKESISRTNINYLTQLSNGMFLVNAKTCFEKKNIIGNKPYFYEIDWMSSLEINSLKDIKIYNFLINQYFEKNT